MHHPDQDLIAALLRDNPDFCRLYERHTAIKEQIRVAREGLPRIADLDLARMKKERLLLKDRMGSMVQSYRSASAG
jgi:uncharacterized protein YdcH (DUF465 family)